MDNFARPPAISFMYFQFQDFDCSYIFLKSEIIEMESGEQK